MESKEREAYRKRCKHYGVDGNCREQSIMRELYTTHGELFCRKPLLISCAPDCNCARMKRYDKMNKKKI